MCLVSSALQCLLNIGMGLGDGEDGGGERFPVEVFRGVSPRNYFLVSFSIRCTCFFNSQHLQNKATEIRGQLKFQEQMILGVWIRPHQRKLLGKTHELLPLKLVGSFAQFVQCWLSVLSVTSLTCQRRKLNKRVSLRVCELLGRGRQNRYTGTTGQWHYDSAWTAHPGTNCTCLYVICASSHTPFKAKSQNTEHTGVKLDAPIVTAVGASLCGRRCWTVQITCQRKEFFFSVDPLGLAIHEPET